MKVFRIQFAVYFLIFVFGCSKNNKALEPANSNNISDSEIKRFEEKIDSFIKFYDNEYELSEGGIKISGLKNLIIEKYVSFKHKSLKLKHEGFDRYKRMRFRFFVSQNQEAYENNIKYLLQNLDGRYEYGIPNVNAVKAGPLIVIFNPPLIITIELACHDNVLEVERERIVLKNQALQSFCINESCDILDILPFGFANWSRNMH